jgi:hypothetical protein
MTGGLVALTAPALWAKSFYIIKIEDNKAYLDLTKQDTISAKLLNVFSKPEIIKHPVSGKEIEISRKLGSIILSEVKDGYAVATIPPQMSDKVELGQKVEFVSSEPIDTAAIAFGQEVVQEMGKLRNSISVEGNFNYIDSNDKFYGGQLNYRYNFLLTYLYSISVGMGYIYGEHIEEKPEFIYAKALFEWKLSSYVSLLTGGRGGVKKDGAGYGLEGGLRLGKPYQTNVILGGGFLQDFGKSGFFQLNGKIGNSWLNFTVQVDNYPVALSDETFRVRFGGKTPISETSAIYGGFSLAGRNTDEVGFGGDLGVEILF